MTTQAYPVVTRGNPDHIEMTVQGVQPKQPLSTQPHRKTLRVEDLHLPATYSSQGSNYTRSGGSMIDGTTT